MTVRDACASPCASVARYHRRRSGGHGLSRHAWRCLAALVLSFGTQASAGDALLWRVSTAGAAPNYLLGSVHVGRPDMYPLPAEVLEAYACGEALVVEADIVAAEPGEIAAKTAALGLYRGGEGLEDTLTTEQWQVVTAAAERTRLSSALLQRQKPWLAYATLTMSAARVAGYREALGVDRYFLEKAHRQGKPVLELEGLDRQLEALSGLAVGQQVSLLGHTAALIVAGDLGVETLLSAWRRGDIDRLQELIESQFPPELAPTYRALVVDRNLSMVQRLVELSQRRQDGFFVLVGAAHLPGRYGLLALLRERGYRIERIRGADLTERAPPPCPKGPSVPEHACGPAFGCDATSGDGAGRDPGIDISRASTARAQCQCRVPGACRDLAGC